MNEANIENRLSLLENEILSLKNSSDTSSGLVMIVFSGDLDRVMATLNIATGALSMGMPVTLFFTFWGTSLLKKNIPQSKNKLFLQKMFGWMLPKGTADLPLSKMNFLGIGPVLMNKLMKRYHTTTPEKLMEVIQEMGANIYICTMTMELMGIKKEELLPIANLQYCGVAKFIEIAKTAKLSYFI